MSSCPPSSSAARDKASRPRGEEWYTRVRGTPPRPAAPQKATPIQNTGPAPSTPAFIGSAATAHPVGGIRPAWQDPFMAPNPTNSVHNDAWQSDVYTQFGGPLGRKPETLSTSIG